MAQQGGQEDEDQERGERQGGQRPVGDQGERENNALRARLDKLTEALGVQSSSPHEPQEDGKVAPGSMGSAMSLALRVLSEFVSAIIVGAAIGWGIDWLLRTLPIFLIVFVLFGAAAGFWNAYRIAIEKPGRDR